MTVRNERTGESENDGTKERGTKERWNGGAEERGNEGNSKFFYGKSFVFPPTTHTLKQNTMKKINLIIILLLIASSSFGQYGEIRGTVTDKISGAALPGATVTWKVNDALKGTVTNDKGEYVIKPLTPGSYDLEFSFVTFKKQPYKAIAVSAEKATYVDVALVQDNDLPEVVIKWTPPLIDKGTTINMITYPADVIEQSMERDVVSFVAQTPSVFQKEEGGSINVRGSREGNTLYIVDGIKMSGPFSLPKSAIAEISVLTGGIPAQFGDATGGVVIITTKSHNMK